MSKNGGLTFDPVGWSSVAPSGIISGLATHPDEAGTAYVLYSVSGSPKVLRTTDYGETWEDLSGFEGPGDTSTNGFPNVAVYDLLVIPHSPNILWAGTEIGIFHSQDHGETWQYSDNGFPALSVWQFALVDGQIVVATHGRGIWTVDADEVVSTENDSSELPAKFTLEQNYPNPFNPSTTIEFSVPTDTRVELTVFDVTGRAVALLTDKVYAAGEYRIEWDAGNMASGVYFYRMKAGDVIQTKRMMLIK